MTAIMKKLSQLLGRAVTAIMKKLSQLSRKVVCFGQWVLSGYLEGHFNIYFMDLAENGKISLNDILLLLV